MIKRDNHGRALWTYPNARHQSPMKSQKMAQFHDVINLPWLMHNHPSGDPTPSRADIDMTKLLIDAAKALSIAVHDHIIVGKHGHISMRGLKLI